MLQKITMLVALVLAITACAPEVGSKAWCEDMAEKSKGDWTANETTEYAQSCLFRSND